MNNAKLVTYDKERNMKFDFNALCDYEQKTGVSITSLDPSRLGLFELRVLIWAGLKHEDQDMSTEKAGEIIQQCITDGTTTMIAIAKDISDALTLSGLFKPRESGKKIKK